MKEKHNFIKLVKYIILNICLLSIIYLLYLKNIRICLIYNIFNIPCPGCGLTTSVIYLLRGDLLNSLKYNIITIPLILGYCIWSCWYLIDLMKSKDTLNQFIYKNKIKIVGIAIIIVIISFIKNITNPLLY